MALFPKPSTRTVLLVILLLLAISIPITLSVFNKPQDVRQRAQEDNGKLLCQPEGGMGNKFTSNTLVVTNEKATPVTIWVQENECDYEGQEYTEGSQCNTFKERYNVTIQPGATESFRRDVDRCKVVQIDANSEGDAGGCFTPDGEPWSGGLGYTIKANSEGYPNNCAEPTNTPRPTRTPTPTRPPQPTTTPTRPTASPSATPTLTPTPGICVPPGAVTNIQVTCPFCQ